MNNNTNNDANNDKYIKTINKLLDRCIASHGDSKYKLKKYIDKNPSARLYINSYLGDKTTLLIYCILKCRFHLVEYLVSVGADINMQDSYGRTPLIHAVRESNSYINYIPYIEKLLQLDADPNIIDINGKKAMDYIKKSQVCELELEDNTVIKIKDKSKRIKELLIKHGAV